MYHTEQLLLPWQGLWLQQGHERLHTQAHLAQARASWGKGLGKAGSNSYSFQEGLQEQAWCALQLPGPVGEQPTPFPPTSPTDTHSALSIKKSKRHTHTFTDRPMAAHVETPAPKVASQSHAISRLPINALPPPPPPPPTASSRSQYQELSLLPLPALSSSDSTPAPAAPGTPLSTQSSISHLSKA